ncbi:alpha/beta hydrolase [Marinivivus vitaminiproducens]|uniref:alpha/beta hydrolase n=1 Tax=Marinivivus vitaminiproducens TaxID=3035935 RepID=UPI0027AA692B|nr:alpha/beta hydrolase [Geminicoccaceae bacterium SCSIO 64248]
MDDVEAWWLRDLEPTMDPDMSRLRARLAVEDAGLPADPTLLPPADGRALFERVNLRWNENRPAVTAEDRILTPGDADAAGLAPAEGLPVRLYNREGASKGALVYLHGGGWELGSIDSHDGLMRHLARESGLAVLGVGYRLAPENPFPAGLHDAVLTLRWLQQEAPAPRLAIGGDSAGANLALAAILHEARAGRPGPAAGLLFYGVFADMPASPSQAAFGNGDYTLSTAKMARYWDWYVPGASDRSEPLVSPLYMTEADAAALPPLFLAGAGLDPLLSDTTELAARLDAAAATFEGKIYPGVIHGFAPMIGHLPAADDLLADSCAWLRRRFA